MIVLDFGLGVFPTGVGMYRTPITALINQSSVPHSCGDEPATMIRYHITTECSPHAWGWTGNGNLCPPFKRVFPTCVGMNRVFNTCLLSMFCVPHMCGDGPLNPCIRDFSNTCSPHTWGWTAANAGSVPGNEVFPTYVGMNRYSLFFARKPICVPHMRGDGPLENNPRFEEI